MLIRRCAALLLEPRENLEFDLKVLFQGRSAFASRITWVALAPHLDREIELDPADLAILSALGETVWVERDELPDNLDAARIDALLDHGLLIADACRFAAHRERDERLRAARWRPLSAVAHAFSRWQGQRADTDAATARFHDIQEMVSAYGPPPPETYTPPSASTARIGLPSPRAAALDGPLLSRYTGRNYDLAGKLPIEQAARLLQRCFGAQATLALAPDVTALKKTSPSGGSLHPIEAYVLAQRVEGIPTGLYHYQPTDHTLAPIQTFDAAQAHATAMRFVAEQHWFADAPMLVVMAARVTRNFWKYRNHPKAYRAIVLDAGHLSQTFYLLASEAGMPAFITAAVNEIDIEQALGLDPIEHAVIAVVGCGPAAANPTTIEFRPPSR